MKIHNYPGFFIDIEGLDGAGASTQVKSATQALRQKGIKVRSTKEPTKGTIGRLIRQALQGKIILPPASLQLLFAADRGEHLEREIIPRLQKGELVITDRFFWSTIAFGSIDLDKEWLINLNRDFILPDLSIFIEVSPAVCLERIRKARGTTELFEEEEKLENVWDTYHYLATKYPFYIVTVNGERSPKRVTEDILRLIRRQPKFKKL